MKKMHVWEARLTRFFSRLPLFVVIGLATFLARLFCLLPLSIARPHRAALVNTFICFPEMSWRGARKFARQSIIETARTLAGYSHVWLRPVEKPCRGLFVFMAWKNGSSHWMTNARSCTFPCTSPAGKCLCCWSERKTPALWLCISRRVTVRWKTSSRMAVRAPAACLFRPMARGRAALTGLEQGKSMALLADHEPGGSSNPFVPFFGHEVMVPPLFTR